MKYKEKIESEVYSQYVSISEEDHHTMVRFYEENTNRIELLSFNLYIEMSYTYVRSLFEVGRYYDLLKIIDGLIQDVILENVYSVKGIDIYQELLLLKGQSLYYIMDYNKADHVLSELVKMNKESLYLKKLYRINVIDRLRYEGQKIKGVCVLFFLLSGLVIGIELLVVRSFYSEWVFIVELLRNTLFLSGLVLFFAQEISFRKKATRCYINHINH